TGGKDMKTILIVDDDPHIRELMRFYLQREGYQAVEAADGQEAMDRMESTQTQSTIDDIMKPHSECFQLSGHNRCYYDITVLMLTEKSEITDKEEAYLSGTDEYVVKPFDAKEILFRIKALSRRFQIMSEEMIQVGQTIINRKSYEVQTNGQTVILPLKE